MSHQSLQKKKYKTLCIEMPLMWDVKCINTPVITGASGKVAKGLKKNLEAITRRNKKKLLPEIAILGTSHMIQKITAA